MNTLRPKFKRQSAFLARLCASVCMLAGCTAEVDGSSLNNEQSLDSQELTSADSCTTQVTIDPRRSLAVTDISILTNFTFERVMKAVAADPQNPNASDATLRERALKLYQQWWRTQGLGTSADDKGGCDAEQTNGTPSLNSFPHQCPRPEAALASTNPFDSVDTNPNAYMPIGLFNRFDLAPTDGSSCGEYRIVFGKRSASTNGFDRLLIIFEANLPNPNPSAGIEGCRPVAQFWANLTSMNDMASRAQALEHFYFVGLDGFGPVVAPKNYAGGVSGGQIRTNQFMQGLTNPWVLKDFFLVNHCDGDPESKECVLNGHCGICVLAMRPVSIKNNPYAHLFDSASSAATLFRSEFVTQVSNLAVEDINSFFMNTSTSFLSGESISSDPLLSTSFEANDYPLFFEREGESGPFHTAIQQQLTAIGSSLTPDQIVKRSLALSCAGCHQLSSIDRAVGGTRQPRGDIGPGDTRWPNSLGFVHVSEIGPENGEGGAFSRFALSRALTDVFLPHRKQVLERFLSGCTTALQATANVQSGQETMGGPRRAH